MRQLKMFLRSKEEILADLLDEAKKKDDEDIDDKDIDDEDIDDEDIDDEDIDDEEDPSDEDIDTEEDPSDEDIDTEEDPSDEDMDDEDIGDEDIDDEDIDDEEDPDDEDMDTEEEKDEQRENKLILFTKYQELREVFKRVQEKSTFIKEIIPTNEGNQYYSKVLVISNKSEEIITIIDDILLQRISVIEYPKLIEVYSKLRKILDKMVKTLESIYNKINNNNK